MLTNTVIAALIKGNTTTIALKQYDHISKIQLAAQANCTSYIHTVFIPFFCCEKIVVNREMGGKVVLHWAYDSSMNNIEKCESVMYIANCHVTVSLTSVNSFIKA